MYNVKILKDSINPVGCRLTTFELTYPRFIHSEFMTHRMFSRNAASSRAIPINKMMNRVSLNPVIPVEWGKNQKGMQAEVVINDDDAEKAEIAWLKCKDAVLDYTEILTNLGVHKQIVNRLLEPFSWITVICSATEYNNFFHLRCDINAQPEIRKLANMMAELYFNSEPESLNFGQYHLPLIFPEDENLEKDILKKISVARCARVSYLTHDGKRNIEADLDLFNRLTTQGHWCYDSETEILTQNGWKKFENILEEDLVAAVDYKKRLIKFERPKGYYISKYEGDMYSLCGQAINLLVTPDHNLIVSSKKNNESWSEFDAIKAKIVFNNKPVRYLKSAFLSMEERNQFENPWNIDPILFAKIVGFFIGDGSSNSKNSISFHLKSKRKIDYICKLFPNIYARKYNKYIINLPNIGIWFKKNCYTKTKEKKIPFPLNITYDEFLGLLDGLKNSDGTIKRKTWLYLTTSEFLKNQLYAFLHINNMSAGHSLRISNNIKHKNLFRLNISNRLSPRVEINQKNRSLSYKESMQYYNGLIYCVETNTGAVLIKRNDKVLVCGNSPLEHVAIATKDSKFRANFKGFLQYRKLYCAENVTYFKYNKNE